MTIPDELVERALAAAYWRKPTADQRERMRAGLAAVADDLRAEARRECVAELRATRFTIADFIALADSWEQR